MNLRQIATGLVAAGMTLGLIGAGVAATYTDTATAQENVTYVGSFGCQLDSTTQGAVVSTDHHTVTFQEPDIALSAPPQGGNALDLSITLTNTGSIPQNVHWTITGPDYNISPYNRPPYNSPNGHFGTSSGSPSMLTDLHNWTGSQTYTSLGFMWLTPLDNTDLGVTLTATYHVDCTDYSPPSRPTYIGGASASTGTLATQTVSLPSGWQPGDLAIGYTWRAASTGGGAGITGFTTVNSNIFTSGLRQAILQRTLAAGDSTFSTSATANVIMIVVYRHAAVLSSAGLFLTTGAMSSTATAFNCNQPANGPMPTDGSAVDVCFAGDTAATNVKSIAPTGTIGLTNRSAGFAAPNAGMADSSDTSINVWPGAGVSLSTWTSTPNNARAHGTASVGIGYAP